MNKVILLSLLSLCVFGTITETYYCDCSAYTLQTDCNNVVDCTWSTTCGDKACSAISADICESLPQCSLNSTSGQCEKSQACSTYTVTNQLFCMLKKGNCGASATATNGVYTCQAYAAATCANLTVANCKNNYEKENTFCWPTSDNAACKAYTLSDCVGVPLDACALIGCDASGTACAAPKCSQITAEASCTSVYNGPFGAETICIWDSTAKTCGERQSVSDLTADNCSLKTDGGYYWSSSGTCTQCVEPTTSNSALMTILVVLLVLIF